MKKVNDGREREKEGKDEQNGRTKGKRWKERGKAYGVLYDYMCRLTPLHDGNCFVYSDAKSPRDQSTVVVIKTSNFELFLDLDTEFS